VKLCDLGWSGYRPEFDERLLIKLIDLLAIGRMIGIISHVTELKEQMA
jgi:DNA repair exonuclease SbcCD ATPase subunit